MAAYKTVTLSRVAILPVSADVNMSVRVVYTNGNSLSAAITVEIAEGAKSLGEIITASYAELGDGQTLNWDEIHWVSLQGDNAFYYNAGANVAGTDVTVDPVASDWTCPANTELRVP